MANKNGDEFVISEETKKALIARALGTPDFRMRLSNSMVYPIMNRAFPITGYTHCLKCNMGWSDSAHVHDDFECVLYRVHAS